MAKTATASAVSTPDSPTHGLYPTVDWSNGPWITAFHTPWAQMQGQMLPEDRRSHPKTKPMPITVTTKTIADSSGWGPDAYCPLRMSGVCQSPQINPLRKIGAGMPEATSRVSMYPRQPISSPAADVQLYRPPTVSMSSRNFTNRAPELPVIARPSIGCEKSGTWNCASPVVQLIP